MSPDTREAVGLEIGRNRHSDLLALMDEAYDCATNFIGSGRCELIVPGKNVEVTGTELSGIIQAARVKVSTVDSGTASATIEFFDVTSIVRSTASTADTEPVTLMRPTGAAAEATICLRQRGSRAAGD